MHLCVVRRSGTNVEGVFDALLCPPPVETACRLGRAISRLRVSGGDRLDLVPLVLRAEILKLALTSVLTALVRRPGLWDLLRREPELVPVTVAESLRWEPPIRLVPFFAREEVRIGHLTVTAGEPVVLMVGAAQRDRAEYSDPDRFDIRREPAPVLSGSSAVASDDRSWAARDAVAVLSSVLGEVRLIRPAGDPVRAPRAPVTGSFTQFPVLLQR